MADQRPRRRHLALLPINPEATGTEAQLRIALQTPTPLLTIRLLLRRTLQHRHPLPQPILHHPPQTLRRRPLLRSLRRRILPRRQRRHRRHPRPPQAPRTPIAMPAFSFTKLDKKPIFGRYGLSAFGSPGRDTSRRGKLSDAVAQKARKRRRHDRDPVIHSRRGSIDSGCSSESASRRHSPHHRPSSSNGQNWFSSLLTGIESRPNLPHLLSYYAQLILNSFLVAVAMYLIYSSIRTIQSDVSKEEARAIDEAHHEIAVCTSHWTTNNCAPHLRVPAVAAACREWEVCMQADPTQVGRAKISAHTFARIVNEFIEPISLKTMLFVVATFLVFGYVNNTAFAAYRSKIDNQPQQQQQQFFHQPPPPSPWPSQQAGDYGWGAIAPPTPRHASGGYGDGNGGPMFAALMPPQTPQRSPRKGGR
ncbi:hypothetical protein VC83_04930 [Pseudogymnoascus destructans]|uniref:Brl1/Brr6 domain-containing protein n=1 Tax=Pseudogymnoascus destructans TaxID=655981 RepID=A0A177A940_9PEZI|nr:uncharacterized protein VC83_04930 [Pseudogymnoascus destructans]OAF58665.1 hypothetical protein VC83_04930 [Pseudogymnoascus destructans]